MVATLTVNLAIWGFMIISVINSKGGVGKTTLALLLAEAFRRRGDGSEVWDADPQGSAYDWAAAAAENDDPLPFPVMPVNKAQLRRQPPAAAWTIVDTPPGDPEAITLAAARADFVLIPTDASPMDMKRAAATLAALDAPAALLFCKINTRTQLASAARTWVETEDVSFLDSVVPSREDAKKIVDGGLSGLDDGLFGVEAVAAELVHALKEG